MLIQIYAFSELTRFLTLAELKKKVNKKMSLSAYAGSTVA